MKMVWNNFYQPSFGLRLGNFIQPIVRQLSWLVHLEEFRVGNYYEYCFEIYTVKNCGVNDEMCTAERCKVGYWIKCEWLLVKYVIEYKRVIGNWVGGELSGWVHWVSSRLVYWLSLWNSLLVSLAYNFFLVKDILLYFLNMNISNLFKNSNLQPKVTRFFFTNFDKFLLPVSRYRSISLEFLRMLFLDLFVKCLCPEVAKRFSAEKKYNYLRWDSKPVWVESTKIIKNNRKEI